MAVDSVSGGTGILTSGATGDVAFDFDPPASLGLPGSPTVVNAVSTALGITSQRIASVAYVRAVAPPAGGTANQVLAKVDATNFNYAWVNQSGGPGGPVAAEDVSVAPAALIPVAITDVQEALVDIYDRGVFIADGGLGPGPVDNGWVIGSPTGGAMGPGTLNVENGIYSDGTLLGGGLGDLPAAPIINGAYLLQNLGGTYSWENDLDQIGGRSVLTFNGPAGGSPYIWMNLLAAPDRSGISMSTAGASSAGVVVDAGAATANSIENTIGGVGFWAVSKADGIGLWVDNIGRQSGVTIEHVGSGEGSQGLFVINHQEGQGRSIRLTHTVAGPMTAFPLQQQPKSRLGSIFGDIVFAGIKGRYGEPPSQGTRGPAYYADGAAILAKATEDWRWDHVFGVPDSPDNASFGTCLEFQTVANGTDTLRTALRIDHDGALFVLHNGALTDLDSLLGTGPGGGIPEPTAGTTIYGRGGTPTRDWVPVVQLAGDTMTGTLAVNLSGAPLIPLSGINALGNMLRLTGTETFGGNIAIDTFGASTNLNMIPRLIFRQASGTPAAPAYPTANAILGDIEFTTMLGTLQTGGSASIRARAEAAWTDGSRPSSLEFFTTEVGTINTLAQMRISQGVTVGVSVPAPAAGLLMGELNALQLYISGQPIPRGVPVAAAWIAGTDPDRVIIYINNTGRALTCTTITGVVEEANGSVALVDVYLAAVGQPMSAATQISTQSFDADGAAGAAQVLRSTSFTIDAGARLGLRVVNPGTTAWADSIATITAYIIG